jgi:hypothetical protein
VSPPSCDYSYAPFTGPSGADAQLYGINDSGTVVGTAAGQGFISQGGSFTMLNVPASFGATNTNAAPSAIADNGLVTGTYFTGTPPDTVTHGFLYNNGQYSSFDVQNGHATIPTGISSDGTVVGETFFVATAYPSDWIRKPDGTTIAFADGNIPSGLRQPGDINDSDVVAATAPNNQYVTWQNGTFTYHTLPSTVTGKAPITGNNNAGDVVGYNGVSGSNTGFAIFGSTSCTIKFPGALDTFAEDVNGSRVIVGYYRVGDPGTPSYALRGFIATPK